MFILHTCRGAGTAMQRLFLLLTLAVGTAFPQAAGATLVDRGNGLLYDTVLDITWLQDASLIRTTGRDFDLRFHNGSERWETATDWADWLVYQGFDDWRLPSMDVNGDGTVVDFCPFVSEMACRDNELAYMFYYNLGGALFDDLTGDQTTADGVTLFGIRLNQWSSTEGPPFPPNPSVTRYWAQNFSFGATTYYDISFTLAGAWAVRSGDVVAEAPEPSAMMLFGTGLAGLCLVRRRRAIGG